MGILFSAFPHGGNSLLQCNHPMPIHLYIRFAAHVDPVGGFTVLPNELVEVGVFHEPGEPGAALCQTGDPDVGGLAFQVLGVPGTANFLVE